jgi:hypothetical protein
MKLLAPSRDGPVEVRFRLINHDRGMDRDLRKRISADAVPRCLRFQPPPQNN